jgi:hypothetical protein
MIDRQERRRALHFSIRKSPPALWRLNEAAAAYVIRAIV